MKQFFGCLLSLSLALAPLTSFAQQTANSELNDSTQAALQLVHDYMNTPADEQELKVKAIEVVNLLKQERSLLQSFGDLYTNAQVREHKAIQNALRLSLKSLKSENKIQIDEESKALRLKILTEALNNSKSNAEMKSSITYAATALLATSFIVSRMVIANSGPTATGLLAQTKLTIDQMIGYFTSHLGIEAPFSASLTASVVMGAFAINGIVHDHMMEEDLEISK